MPELPEVETARTGLEQMLQGARIARVTHRRPDLRVPLPPELPQAITGQTLEHIDRRAKYLLFHFGNGAVVIGHLGMSGRMVVHPQPPAAFGKHDHVTWEMEDGRTMVFTDPRRFGLMLLSDEASLAAHPLLAHLGPEPLGDDFTSACLYAQLQRRKGPVKPALMDQKLVVGVGNIYASEALFRAGISPLRAGNRIARSRIVALHAAIREVLKEAIASGGSTLRDHVQSTGSPGYFQHAFAVYGRDGKPCLSCGLPLHHVTQVGRSTYFCAHCQR